MVPKVNRSPNAPSRSLSHCLDSAQQLYEAFPNSDFNKVQIANHLGLSSESGGLRGLLSDLKQYGLIVRSSGNDYRVSDVFKEYTLAPDEHARHRFLYRFITSSPAFLGIIEQQGYHLPNEKGLVNVLMARSGYKPEKAQKTARALINSLNWAGCLDKKGNVTAPTMEASANQAVEEAQQRTSKYAGTAQQDTQKTNGGNASLTVDIPIGEGRIVHVQYPADLSSAEAEKAARVLQALSATPTFS